MTNSWSLRSPAVTSANALQTHMVLPVVTIWPVRRATAAGTSFHMLLVDPASLCGLRPYMFSEDALPSAYDGVVHSTQHGSAESGRRTMPFESALGRPRPAEMPEPHGTRPQPCRPPWGPVRAFEQDPPLFHEGTPDLLDELLK